MKKALAGAAAGAEKARAQYFLDGFLARKSELEDGIPLRDSADMKSVATLIASAFDKDMSGWSNWQRDYSKAKFHFDAAAGHAAPGALRVDASGSEASPLCFTRRTPVEQGKMYRATAWVRGENLATDGTVSLTIKWLGAKGEWLGLSEQAATVEASDAGEWRRLNVCFRIGPGERWSPVRFAVVLLTTDHTSQGSAWFDDVQFEEVQLAR